MRLLIVGATGQVGRALVEHARVAGIDAVGVSRGEADLDLRVDLVDRRSAVRILDRVRPTHVILAAAATNVEWCQLHPGDTWRVNVEGTYNFANACRERDAVLAFFSTDYVFDGAAGPYEETDRPGPINAYGTQKLEAENIVLGSNSRNLVIRTCQVFGPDSRRLNAVLRIVDDLRFGRTVKAPMDLYGTPTYSPDLARVTAELLALRRRGIWHVAGPDLVSRHQLALLVTRHFKLDSTRIAAVLSSSVGYAAPRPPRSGLLSRLLDGTQIRPVRPLADALTMLAALEAQS